MLSYKMSKNANSEAVKGKVFGKIEESHWAEATQFLLQPKWSEPLPITRMANPQSLVFPAKSVAEQATADSPIGNRCPLAGEQSTVGGCPELSEAVVFHLIIAVGSPGSLTLVRLSGHEIFGLSSSYQ